MGRHLRGRNAREPAPPPTRPTKRAPPPPRPAHQSIPTPQNALSDSEGEASQASCATKSAESSTTPVALTLSAEEQAVADAEAKRYSELFGGKPKAPKGPGGGGGVSVVVPAALGVMERGLGIQQCIDCAVGHGISC